MPYRKIRIPKKNGSRRTIWVPDQATRVKQIDLLDSLAFLAVHNAAHGFIRGRSIFTSAGHHVGKRLVITLDLVDFFPSIKSTAGRLISSQLMAELIRAESFVRRGHIRDAIWTLPQGAITSPVLSNICCYDFDRDLAVLMRDAFNYTRYADDLVFSIDDRLTKNQQRLFVDEVAVVCGKYGFELNRKKTRIMPDNIRQEVHGLVVNRKINLSPAMVAKILGNRCDYTPEQLAGYLAYLDNFCSKSADEVRRALAGGGSGN